MAKRLTQTNKAVKKMKKENIYKGKQKELGPWFTGSLIVRKEETGKERTFILTEVGGQYFEVEVIPESVAQYIGRKDQNGVQIWEGDICRFSYSGVRHVGWISYNLSFAEYDIVWKDTLPSGTSGYTRRPFRLAERIEKIGNVFDEFDLLEKK